MKALVANIALDHFILLHLLSNMSSNCIFCSNKCGWVLCHIARLMPAVVGGFSAGMCEALPFGSLCSSQVWYKCLYRVCPKSHEIYIF